VTLSFLVLALAPPSQESDRGLHYTVHYSSCAQQQLGPLAAGRQLLLVYDLVWKGPPGGAGVGVCHGQCLPGAFLSGKGCDI
jgi:hypothetical protein